MTAKGKSDDALDAKVLAKERDELQNNLEAVQADFDTLSEEADKLKDLAARSQADLQNAKDRLDREAQDLKRFARADMLMGLLPTIDNFQRAFQHLPEDLQSHEWVQGIVAVEADLMKKLTEAGLTQIESVGQQVDTEKHEVLQAGPGEDGIITQVFEEGFELNGKVLRPAKVMVGDGSAE